MKAYAKYKENLNVILHYEIPSESISDLKDYVRSDIERNKEVVDNFVFSMSLDGKFVGFDDALKL